MQAINENDVLEFVIEGSCEQQPWALVRHYLVNTVTTPETFLGNMTSYWETTVLPAWQTVATSLWVAECMSISRVAPQPMNVWYKGFVPAIVGDIETDGLPPMNAVLVRLLTDEVGPRNRGRCYLTGCPEASTNGGVLLASVEAAWDSLAATIAAPISISGDSATPCIFSRTNYVPAGDPPVYPPVANYTSAITSHLLQGNIATIRRRRTKRSSFSS